MIISPPSILVVDDDELLRQSICRLCAKYDLPTVGVDSGKEALDLLRQREFALVLLDLRMPSLDGIEVLRQLKDRGKGPACIVITGCGSVEMSVEAMRQGAVDFIEKPFSPKVLIEKIKEHLPASGENAVVVYIREHANEIRSRSEAAKALGLVDETVSRHVLKVTGLKFEEFVQRCKLDQAKTLLESTNLNIAQIADRTGFSTPEFFARVCRRVLGMSPSQYRRYCRLKRSIST